MIKIEDFENAPVGATATRANGHRAMKVDAVGWGWIAQDWVYLDDEEMVQQGYVLDPSAATASREALDLAWVLAHEVKPGQVIPIGTRCISHSRGGGLGTFTASIDWAPSPRNAENIRTLEPLPDPKPDWLDAPAVLARLDAWNRDERAVFVPTSTLGRWTRADTDWTYHWHGLRDVTPLYSKGLDA